MFGTEDSNDRDIFGNRPNDIWGNTPGDVHGSPPSDVWGSPLDIDHGDSFVDSVIDLLGGLFGG
ncbi:hypothetical protein [Anatilimnocola floriformis]|uniref:hypothetical protein n=1 Tax=Anatilimnocola floriformis TaxID=2948575 RepID=UPI0020C582A1|nr:hypothetical protein [Anatilimnocola floriformis]